MGLVRVFVPKCFATRDAKEIAKLLAMVPLPLPAGRSVKPLKNESFAGAVNLSTFQLFNFPVTSGYNLPRPRLSALISPPRMRSLPIPIQESVKCSVQSLGGWRNALRQAPGAIFLSTLKACMKYDADV